MLLSAGTRLGPYEILAPIGSGGMGEVYKARDTRLDRMVAIKKLKGEHGARFEKEARAIAAVNHANICQIHDIGPDYLVMEYVEGKPLSGPMSAEDALRVAIQIASALEEAHGNSILHCDLKPSNILVTSRGAVKLVDFGLAKLAADSDPERTKTMDGTIRGTAAYMAPEQAEGKALDERSDIFSFGAVFYEMLSGRQAFGGNTMLQVLSAVLRDEPRPLDVTTSLRNIVSRCLRKVPADRFQSAADLRTALESVATSNLSEKAPSIAVLPFANMSGDKENEYFSDGLAEEIINALSQVPGLKVTARTSAFFFKGKDVRIGEIARDLGVEHILEGSVRKAGDRIRVTAQLIKAGDGFHLWSQRYDRDLADVFAIQDEIARAIAAALQVQLSVQPAAVQRHTPSLAAYEAYLKARHHIDKLMLQSLELGREYLEQAIALDSKFALAHIELSNYFLNRALSGLFPAREAMPLARSSAQRALDIDPSLAEAHAMLGVVAGLYDYDWEEAGRRFRHALAHDPVPPAVYDLYGSFYLLPVGRTSEAAQEIERTLKEDPLAVVVRVRFAVCLTATGKNSEADAQFRQILELDENLPPALVNVGINHALHGRFAEARACLERAHSLAPWNPNVTGLLAGVLLRTGETGRAESLVDKLRPGQAYGAPRGLAVFHLLCGEVDQAAHWTEQALEQRDPLIVFILRLPLCEALRFSSRWPAVAKMMNLPHAPP